MPFGLPNPVSQIGKGARTIGGAVHDAASSADTGISAIRDRIGSSFSTAENIPAASRVFAHDLVANVRKEAVTPGTPGNKFANAPLLGLGSLLPQNRVVQGVARALAPSPMKVVSDVRDVSTHPSIGSALATANDAVQIATLPAAGMAAKNVAEKAGQVSARALAARGLDIAGEAGARQAPGFLRDATQLARDNNMVKVARAAAQDAGQVRAGANVARAATESAGETTAGLAKSVASRTSKVTGEVLSQAELQNSGLVRGAKAAARAATAPGSLHDEAQGAASAARAGIGNEPTPGSAGFARGIIERAAKVVKSPVTGPIAAAKQVVATAGHLKEAAVHPGPINTPKHAAMAIGTAGKALADLTAPAAAVAGALGVRGSNTKLGSLTRAVTGGGIGSGVLDRGNASGGNQTDQLAKNMNMSTTDFKAISAVYEKYGDAGLAALTKGLAKTESTVGKQNQGDFTQKARVRKALRENVAASLKTNTGGQYSGLRL